jgi:hypothetical protein
VLIRLRFTSPRQGVEGSAALILCPLRFLAAGKFRVFRVFHGSIPASLGGQEKAVPAGLISNSLEFEGIKIRVVYLFPNAEKEDGVLVLEPLLNERAATLKIPYHVGERDVVAMFPGQDGDGCALDFDGGFPSNSSPHLVRRGGIIVSRLVNSLEFA